MRWEYLYIICEFHDNVLYATRFNSGEPIKDWKKVSEKSRKSLGQEWPLYLEPQIQNNQNLVLIDTLSHNLGELGWELVAIGGMGPMVAAFKRSKGF